MTQPTGAGAESVRDSDALTVLVVDDEPLARRGLRRLLEAREDVTVVGECDNGLAAIAFMAQQPLDLVLLDVQMPGLDGIEVVRRVGADAMPLVVFVTAFDDFAISAFDLAAIDYVVKPFTDERLMQAIDRALARRAERSASRSLGRLITLLERESPGARLTPRAAPGSGSAPTARFRERFLVSIGSKDAVVHASEIAWIRASGYYASLVTHDRKEYLLRIPLDQLERELDPAAFVRVHRSAIVSLGEVSGMERSPGRVTMVVLRTGTRVPVSRSRRESVLRTLGGTGS